MRLFLFPNSFHLMSTQQEDATPKLVYLTSGQVIIGFCRYTLDLDTLNIRSPRELMVTPLDGGKADIHLIPFGHLCGIPIATVPILALKSAHYYTVALPSPELADRFRKSQESADNF
jgi:hypothetical protein